MIDHKWYGPSVGKQGKESDVEKRLCGREDMDSVSQMSTVPMCILSYLGNLGLACNQCSLW